MEVTHQTMLTINYIGNLIPVKKRHIRDVFCDRYVMDTINWSFYENEKR